MKSFIVSVCLAIILTLFGLFQSYRLEKASEDLIILNNEIQHSLEENQFSSASDKVHMLAERIEDIEPFFASLGDHSEIDEIEITLRELEKYTEGKIKYDALAKSNSLTFLFEHIPKNHRVKIENIF